VSSEIATEIAPCDLCGACEWKTLFIASDRRHRKPGEFGVSQCLHCGHLQTNPRPSHESMRAFYPDDYSAHSISCHRVLRSQRDILLLDKAQCLGFIGKMMLPIATYRFRQIVPLGLKVSKGTLLEIGCGTGWFLGLAKAMGWRAIGIDISQTACHKAASMWGVWAICSQDFPLPFKSGSFRLVVMHHVLEHLTSPRRALSEVYRVLQDGGWVAIEVPNANSLGRRIFGPCWDSWELPRHLHHFTPKTLRRFLEIAGFQNIRISNCAYKPFVLSTFWLPRRSLSAVPLKLLLGLPTWAFLPLLVFRQQGEMLRAWGQKPISFKA